MISRTYRDVPSFLCKLAGFNGTRGEPPVTVRKVERVAQLGERPDKILQFLMPHTSSFYDGRDAAAYTMLTNW